MATSSNRYGLVAVLLHWTIAILIFTNIWLGWNFDNLHGPDKLASLNLHKSIGMSVLILSVLRLIWRLVNKPPALAAHLSSIERIAARTVHGLFYFFMIAMPLTGWAMTSASPKIKVNPVTFFNLFNFPALPWFSTLPHDKMHAVHETLEQAHTGYILYLGYALIVLHVLGALKHQFFDRDGELGRMLPFLREPGKDNRGVTAMTTTRLFATAALAAMLTIGGAAVAAKPAPAKPAAAPAREILAQAWTVDRAQSRIGFRASQEGTAFEGNFKTWTAAINFDPKRLAASKVVVSVATGSAFTADADRDQTLPTDDWFAVKRFPTATFVATKFTAQGGGRYQATGDLAIKGAHRQVALPFTLAVTGDVARATGTLTLDRTAFNVGAGKWKAPDEVGTKVAVVITVVARRAR